MIYANILITVGSVYYHLCEKTSNKKEDEELCLSVPHVGTEGRPVHITHRAFRLCT